MFASLLILGVAAFFLYVAFSKRDDAVSPSDSEPDDMEIYNPVRGQIDDVYARAWGQDNTDE